MCVVCKNKKQVTDNSRFPCTLIVTSGSFFFLVFASFLIASSYVTVDHLLYLSSGSYLSAKIDMIQSLPP